MAHDAPQQTGPSKLVIRNIGLLLSGAMEKPILDADTVVAENGRITGIGRAKDLNTEGATTIVDTNGTKSIRNGVQRTVNPGDILYVPPGVPHHFTDMKGFRAWLMRFDTIGLVRSKPEPLQAPVAAAPAPAGRGRGGAAAPPVPDLPIYETAFWTNADIQKRWKDNEANKRINSRLYNGPANISGNVRIVLDGDAPATHEDTADLWLVTAGTAIARTDGEIVQSNGASTIRNGVQRTVHPGDLLYVPPGVPHHFTDMKGFRALLIRYDVVGWVQVPSAAQ